MENQFALDVIQGLTNKPKYLSSKYFYDETGDALFQRIMNLDDYYLTACEYEILSHNKRELLQIFKKDIERFNLVEFGAGDGYKTKILLEYFLYADEDFKYIPIDISGNVLEILESSLQKQFPDLQIEGIENDYFKALNELENEGVRNVILFLGSNIGNFTRKRAIDFLSSLYKGMRDGDLLLIGFDLKKDPSTILKAYDDREGVTKAFNFNLLTRINNELGGNFDLSRFKHFPSYNPQTGTTESYLISTENQTVQVNGSTISFDAWETIHMEISQKYSLADIQCLADEAGFSPIRNFYDRKNFFVDSVWMK